MTHKRQFAPWTAPAVVVILATALSARADTPVSPAEPAPAAAQPASPAPAAASSPAAVPSKNPATTQASRFDDTEVRRGASASTPDSRAGTAGTSGASDIPRLLAALAAVIGVIFFLRWLVRRFFSLPTTPRGSSVVQVLSRSMLSPRQHLVLVRVGQRVIVASDNGSQVSPLSEIVDPDEVASLLGQLQSEKDTGAFGVSSTRAFNSIFGRLRKSHVDREPEDEMINGNDLEDATDAPADERADGAKSNNAASQAADNIVAATRNELNGLLEKVRLVSDQFGKS